MKKHLTMVPRQTTRGGVHSGTAVRIGGRIPVALFCVGLTAALSLGADEPPRVAADQVVRETLAHSLALQSSQKEVEAADARLRQASAETWPRLDVQLQATRYEGLEKSLLGQMEIPEIENRYAASATLVQPLYTGGRIRGLKRSAAMQKAAAAHASRGVRFDIVFQAVTAYWNWSKAHHSASALETSVVRMEAHAADIRNLQRAGLATENETLATEVLLDQTRLRLNEARRKTQLAALQIAFLTGRDLPEGAAPEVASRTEAPVPPEAEVLKTALTNRPEIAACRAELLAADAVLRASGSGAKPQLALLVRGEEMRPNNLFFPPEDEWNGDVFAGAQVSWNLFDAGSSRACVAEARARREQARLRLKEAEDRVLLDVREARVALLDALERLTVARRVQQSAERNLRAATDLWRNGLARHADVLDAHAELTESASGAIAAGADVVLARAKLDRASGLLSGKEGE